MHWCNFCQTYHSSASCYHPGNPTRSPGYSFLPNKNNKITKEQLISVVKELNKKMELNPPIDYNQHENKLIDSIVENYDASYDDLLKKKTLSVIMKLNIWERLRK